MISICGLYKDVYVDVNTGLFSNLSKRFLYTAEAPINEQFYFLYTNKMVVSKISFQKVYNSYRKKFSAPVVLAN